uniref:Uncharacterized protein n=1 Tax=Glossina palpalis gambiensis TaxID=67801 RepID=A0A1B0BAJ1_9MUSC
MKSAWCVPDWNLMKNVLLKIEKAYSKLYGFKANLYRGFLAILHTEGRHLCSVDIRTVRHSYRLPWIPQLLSCNIKSPQSFTVTRVVPISPQIRLAEDNPASISLYEIYKISCAKMEVKHDFPIMKYYERLSEVQ